MRSIKIFYPNNTTNALEMKFINAHPEQVDGVQVLLERVAKVLLTAPSSNLFSPTLGSSVGNKVSMTFTDPIQVELMINSAVEKVQEQILLEQSGLLNISSDQLLEKLVISQIFKSPEDQTVWHVEILVYTQGNQAFFLTV